MSKEIKQPITKGIARVPLIMQLEALECGAASLAMVMAYYNKWVPLEQVREDTAVSRDGSNAKYMMMAAKKYGFKVKGYAIKTQKLRTVGVYPAIIHWDKAHFVVLCGFKGKHAVICDPAKGVIKLTIDEFNKHFTGIYLEITPDEGFEPGGKRKSVLSFAKKRLVGAVWMIAFFSIITIAFYVLGIFDPIVKQQFVDRILSGENPEWLLPFILIISGIGLANILITLVKQIFSYKINGKLAISGNTTFMWKLLKLPISFFSQRMTGDLQERKDANESIAETLVNVFAPLILNSIILIVYLVLMLRRSYIMTIIGVTSVLINTVISQILVRKRVNISRVFARDNAMLSAATSKGIEMIETIKSSGAENGYFHQWSEYKESATRNNKKLSLISNAYSIIPSLISMVINYTILFLGVYFTMIGDFTVGAIVGFQGLLNMFMSPANSLIDSGQAIQETRTAMERIDDVMSHPEDPLVERNVKIDNYEKVAGDIEIKDLTFGYNKLEAPLIEGFSLSIKKGEKIAIVGRTGCGKSTLAKLITGLYQPWSGEVLFSGKHISEIDRDVFTNSVSVVDQDVYLFEDTVENNIRMWDESIDQEEIIRGAKDAKIHDDILARPGGYAYNVLEGGKNLSGGEKQRLEIARALARDPTILILDEATSALDAKTEDYIINAIKDRGITCLLVAHRLSTVRDADKIIVLDKGKMIECGTHKELMDLKGYYYNLIKSD